MIPTKGFRDDLWIDVNGAPLTSAATITERLRRPNFGTLEVEITVDDPKVYARPWTVSIKQGRDLPGERKVVAAYADSPACKVERVNPRTEARASPVPLGRGNIDHMIAGTAY